MKKTGPFSSVKRKTLNPAQIFPEYFLGSVLRSRKRVQNIPVKAKNQYWIRFKSFDYRNNSGPSPIGIGSPIGLGRVPPTPFSWLLFFRLIRPEVSGLLPG